MRFQCPACKGIVAVDNTDLGIDVQCGLCQNIVTVPDSRVAPGTLIADFLIQHELGRGGMGVVYKAHQISLDRSAALKILSENYANNAQFVANFIREARAAAKLNHPHIVQAYAVGEDEGLYYFAMEEIDGCTMKDILMEREAIPCDQALLLVQQIAEALNYAWQEQKLIHRDIKPDNIMLTANGRAKLSDLGLARRAEDLEEDSDEIMGTPQYISPEHLTGAPMDIRSDIYSLGATFYHFVTGRFAFHGNSASEIARKHLEEPLVSPEKYNRNIPRDVSAIIMKMMEKNPQMRYQDASMLVDDLRKARHKILGTENAAQQTITLLEERGQQPAPAKTSRKLPGHGRKTMKGLNKTSMRLTAVNAGVHRPKKAVKDSKKSIWAVAGIVAGAALALAAVITLCIVIFSGEPPKPEAKPVQTVQEPVKTQLALDLEVQHSLMDEAIQEKRPRNELRRQVEEFLLDLRNGNRIPENEMEIAEYRVVLEQYAAIEEPAFESYRKKEKKRLKAALEKRQKKLAAAQEAAEKAEQAKKAAEEKAKRDREARARQVAELRRKRMELTQKLPPLKKEAAAAVLAAGTADEIAGLLKDYLKTLASLQEDCNEAELKNMISKDGEWAGNLQKQMGRIDEIAKAYATCEGCIGMEMTINGKGYKILKIDKGKIRFKGVGHSGGTAKFPKDLDSDLQKQLLEKSAEAIGASDSLWLYAMTNGMKDSVEEYAGDNPVYKALKNAAQGK